MRRSTHRGFTLVEMAVVVAIVAILAALAGTSLAAQRPRANLASAASELQGAMYTARQTALATGHEVSVLVFPDFVNPTQGTGRFIIYDDAFFDFFAGGATGGVTFAAYDPAVLQYGTSGSAQSRVVDTMDLPLGVSVGPATGMGATATLSAPYASVVVNVACSFCDASGSARRGAVRFDGRGQVTFFNSATSGGVSTPVGVVDGASLSVQATDVAGQRTLVITSPGGALRSLTGG